MDTLVTTINNRGLSPIVSVQIVHNMTEKQNAHFVSKTNDYIRMFTELAEGR